MLLDGANGMRINMVPSERVYNVAKKVGANAITATNNNQVGAIGFRKTNWYNCTRAWPSGSHNDNVTRR